jgi:hypothetical protein
LNRFSNDATNDANDATNDANAKYEFYEWNGNAKPNDEYESYDVNEYGI